ncbi:hypothetical protein [Saccharopolyspora thermophila]|nr:hypothetical protein [Saccharopolyspora subtropica]
MHPRPVAISVEIEIATGADARSARPAWAFQGRVPRTTLEG